MSTAESGVSGVSGVDPAPGAAGGAGAQAEMITKKLANYWCIIGSIPLVMFLLVAIPTIFYVKKFSEYVNAEYCDTKSCKDLSDAIAKAGSIDQACANFGTHVCKAKMDFMNDALKKLNTEALAPLPDGATAPKGTAVLAKVASFLGSCIGKTIGDDGVDPFYKGALGGNLVDYKSELDAGKLSAVLSSFGCDGLVRAVAFFGNTSGNQDTVPALELSAPVHDFYSRMLIAAAGVSYEDVAKAISPPDDDDLLTSKPLTAARKQIDDYILGNARTSKQTRPKIVKFSDLRAIQGDKWKWEDYLNELNTQTGSPFTDDTMVRIVHPKYLHGLDTFLKDGTTANTLFIAFINVVQQVDAVVSTYGRMVLPKFQKNKEAYCVLQADRLFPGTIGHNSFYKRAIQFGAQTGINPGGTNDSAMMAFLDGQVRQVLDSMAFSYSLSTSSTEENRVAFYRKTLNISVSPGFFNNTDGLSDVELNAMSQAVQFSDDLEVIQSVNGLKKEFQSYYWAGLKNKTTAYFKFRNPYDSLYATFTATENHLYVPMSVFTPPIFRNSQKNRIFTATSGFLVIAGMMKAISLTDSMVVKDQLTPENWIGYSWTRKVERYSECLAQVRSANDSVDSFTDIFKIGAVTPSLRFFRRQIFQKAYPRPEFRIDWASDLSSTQLFFYAWGMLHCGTPEGQKLIDMATKTNRYFLESFECKAKLANYDKSPCDLWNTTRREY